MIRSIAVAAMLLASASASLAQNSPYFRWQAYGQGASTTVPPVVPPVGIPETKPLQKPDLAGDITLTPAYLPQGFEGEAYSGSVTATGKNGTEGPFEYVIYNVPGGMDTNGNTIFGTPYYADDRRVQILVIPTVGDPVTFERTIRVNAQVRAYATLPNGKVGQAYDRGSVNAFFGKGGPYSISVDPASLAGTGLTYDAAANRFVGTPQQAGTYSVAFTARDASGAVAGGVGDLIIERGDLHLAVEVGSPRPVEKVGSPVGIRFLKAKNPVGTVTYGATGLPPQVTVEPTTGVFSGTPSAAGTYSVTFTATDSTSATVSAGPYPIVVQAAPNLSQITADYDVETMMVGTAVDESGDIKGGAPDEYNGDFYYYCRVNDGNSQEVLPGVRLDGCNIKGTPMSPGTYTYAIEVIDSRIGQTGWDEALRKEYTSTVLPPKDRSPFGLIEDIYLAHIDFPNSSITSFVGVATTEQRKQMLQDGITTVSVLGVETIITPDPGYDQTYSAIYFSEPVVLSGIRFNVMGNTGSPQMFVVNDAGHITAIDLAGGTGNQTVSFPKQPVWALTFGPLATGIGGDISEWRNAFYQITEMEFVQ